MIVCPACRHHNPHGENTCEACGASLENATQRACPACGASNDLASQYCHRCLGDLTALSAPSAADAPTGQSVEAPSDQTATKPKEARLAQDDVHDRGQVEKAQPEKESAPEFLMPENAPDPDDGDLVAPMDPDQELAWLQSDSQKPQDLDAMPGWAAQHVAPSQPAEPDHAPADDQAELDVDHDPAERQTADEHRLAPSEKPAPVVQISDANMFKPQVLDALQELEHAIPIETAVALPHRSRARKSSPTPEIEHNDASLFQRIANQPASLTVPAHKLMSSKHRSTSRWTTILLNMVVVVAIALPYFSGGITQTWIAPSPQVVSAVDALTAIEPDETVLVALDYTPAYAGELDPMATAVIRQLARQGCQIVALSTEPAGVAIADDLLAQVAQGEQQFVYGEDYVLLGYLAGESAGLRALANHQATTFSISHPIIEDNPPGLDPLGEPIDIKSVQNVILFAEDVDDVVRWIEQTQHRREWSLHAFASSRIAPALAPYHQSGQLATLLGAAESTIMFEIAANLPSTPARHADSQALVAVLVVLVAIVANAYAIASGSNRQRRA